MMRAKMNVVSVTPRSNHPDGTTTQVDLDLRAVGASSYPADGSDENNTFAKWTPTAHLTMCITNPALFDAFKPGDELYVDFTKA